PAGLGSPTTLTGLKPGTHQLKLTAETPAAMTGSTSVTIEVLADGDQDGIPNGVESKYPCLSPTKADSGGDPDVDGLTSSAEYLRRTNPCKPDTDVDGWSDGDEVRLGGDPRSAKSEPNTARIFLDSESLNLGTCASPKAGIVPVQTSSKAVHWTVRADVPFLSVSGGGVGAGSVSVKPKCAGLTKGRTYLGHVGVEANGGRFVQITVGFRT
ncbi:MAG TPA: hypothetical protein VNN79_01325, partial [Actinomycetota bacterium]|nr:hypothetical protein [Actinomycetota bacterium]